MKKRTTAKETINTQLTIKILLSGMDEYVQSSREQYLKFAENNHCSHFFETAEEWYSQYLDARASLARLNGKKRTSIWATTIEKIRSCYVTFIIISAAAYCREDIVHAAP